MADTCGTNSRGNVTRITALRDNNERSLDSDSPRLDHSDKRGIAPDCGMALEPVYEGDTDAHSQAKLQPGGVALTAERQQLIGIRVAVATKSTGLRTIRTTGRIVPEDGRLYRIQAGFE